MASFDAIIIGGGAAGLMCAMTTAQRGRKVLVLERSNKVGKKILMSGGGRCNFTNLLVEPDNFISQNPHFCKSALKQYTQWDFIGLVEKHAIPYHEKTQGQLFCNRSAKDILNMLLNECRDAGVSIKTHIDVNEISHDSGQFHLRGNSNRYASKKLVIASGGLSIPSLGGSGFGYRVAKQFNLPLIETRAALVPLAFSDPYKPIFADLAGLSVGAEVNTQRRHFRDAMLFTHRGLSGPAILQASSYWQGGENIHINLLPAIDACTLMAELKQNHPTSLLRSQLGQHLPRALIQQLEQLWWRDKADLPLAEWSAQALMAVAEKLTNWDLLPAGTEGYRTAEVTLGGVDTNYLSSKTMEAATQNGLYFIGEVVDVTGHLGGFNFQWAWSSGYVAGQHI